MRKRLLAVVGIILVFRILAHIPVPLGDPKTLQWVLMVAALTGGSMLLMWLGELVTEQGVGNGISLIITVGIVSRLPANIASIIGSVVNKKQHWHLFGHSLPIDKKGFYFSIAVLF